MKRWWFWLGVAIVVPIIGSYLAPRVKTRTFTGWTVIRNIPTGDRR